MGLVNLALLDDCQASDGYGFTVLSVEDHGRIFRIGGDEGDGIVGAVEALEAGLLVVNFHHANLAVFDFRHGLGEDDVSIVDIYIYHGITYDFHRKVHVIPAIYIHVGNVLVQILQGLASLPRSQGGEPS